MSDILEKLSKLEERLDALEKKMDSVIIDNGEARMAGLEKVASDAIGSAHTCITNAIGRAEVMIGSIGARVDRLEMHGSRPKETGQVAGGVTKYGLTRSRL